MDSCLRAALIAMTAIGRHLLHSTLGTNDHTVSGAPSGPSTELRQLVRHSRPFSAKSCAGEFLPCQEAMKPKLRVPSAGTALL